MKLRENIIKEGLTWQYRNGVTCLNNIKCENDVSTNEINFVLNKYKPCNKYPSNIMNRNKCIFMTFEGDNIPNDNLRNLIVKIDSSFLDYKKLFVAPLVLADLIMYGLLGMYSASELELISEHYWGNCFPFLDYLDNREIIKKVFEKMWNVEYIPEILYMGEIEPRYLEVMEHD